MARKVTVAVDDLEVATSMRSMLGVAWRATWS